MLAAFEETGNVTRACKKVKLNRRVFYQWLQKDKKFKAYEQSLKQAIGVLEDEAKRRAVEGVLEPVYYKGEKVST